MGLADALIPGVASNAAALGSRKQLKFKEFTSSGTLVVGTSGDATTAATMFNVFLVGGGGGGGCGSVTAVGAGTVTVTAGGPGGGGEVKQFMAPASSFLNGSSSGTITVTIGAGGVAATGANGGSATVGGDSSFGHFQVFGGGKGGASIYNNATETTVSATKRFTSAPSRISDHSATATAKKINATGGGGGGMMHTFVNTTTVSENVAFYLTGLQNGRNASGTANTSQYNPDSETPESQQWNQLRDSNTWQLGGRAGSNFNGTATANGWYGRGGVGYLGFGGGGAGAIVSNGGTTVAQVLVLPTAYWTTDYNQPRFYNVDGGGRGAIVTTATTANYVAATSGFPNSGGGGGAGAAYGTGGSVYNSVSAGGSGAAGYCLVYWWE